MKIVLTMNLPFLRCYGGANRSNRSLVESLASRGHELRVVVPTLSVPTVTTEEEFLSELSAQNIQPTSLYDRHLFRVGGAEIIAVRGRPRLRSILVEEIRSFEPDWVLVSSEDQSQNLLQASLTARPERVVYLAHTPQMFPFGPASLYPGEARTRLIRQTAGIIAISEFVANYVRQWTGREVFINHPPHYGLPPFTDYGSLQSGFVLMMNPCAVKGISILISLARTLAHIPFAVVPGYGTTQADKRRIASLRNVTLLKNSRNVDELLRHARLLLMPSLWPEGFGMAVVDAMLRGIPVLASNVGGLPEAKLGTEFVIDVAPVSRFKRTLDDALLPVPIVPPQDIRPWREAIETLMGDRQFYTVQSSIARDLSSKFVSTLSCAPLETFLMELDARRHSKNRNVAAVSGETLPVTGDVASSLLTQLRQLTPEQRSLLILRLNKSRC